MLRKLGRGSSYRAPPARLTVPAALGVLSLLAAAPDHVQAETQTFAVTAANTQNWTVDGQPDPALALYRGRTYTFNVNVSAIHPFYIKSVPGAGTADQFVNGVSGNGVTTGALTFTVPANAPSTLYYQCSNHAAMSGVINVVDVAPVPFAGAGWLATLGVALLALTARASRRSARAGV